jgi:RNA polymerase sigma-70 factor, ECF subfamily
MTSSVDAEKIELFEAHRPRLFGIAYRMLGTRDDAEDILQETYLRLHSADLSEIENSEAWLVTVATRLSIDRLRKASVQRETYIGPWLPEPLIIDSAMSPEMRAETASNVSLAFMVLLERLSPLERAIFLLHDVFDFAHAEIARIVAKSETAVRQIVSRARTRVRSERTRFAGDNASRSDLIRKFMAASCAGDEKTLMHIFADDVALTSDGGGKVNAARRIVYGNHRITRLYTVALAKHRDRIHAELVTINGEPGVVEFADGEVFAATTFSIVNGKITAIYRVMNPDKLRRIVPIEKKV